MSTLRWFKVPISPRQIMLSTVLRCGQSFRWRQIDGVWSICMSERVLFMKQDSTHLYYASIPPSRRKGHEAAMDDAALVRDYFNLDVDLEVLWAEWCRRDPRFAKTSLSGVRMLRQDPWETLCAFICSSNNNIKRISKMVDSLCSEFGPFVAEHEGMRYYDFPSPQALSAPGVEEKLRKLGFGYRARFIAETARMVSEMEDGLSYLSSLRNASTIEAHESLLKFTGVGPKVADCVCLMSLDKHEVVPIDTHIWKIAARDYKMNVRTTSARNYKIVQDGLARVWGDHAGWAHSVLFTNDLSDLNNGINLTSAMPATPDLRGRKIKKEEPSVEVA